MVGRLILLVFVACSVASACIGTDAQAVPLYRMTSLDNIGVRDINNVGQIVGTTGAATGEIHAAFLDTDAQGSVIDLGTLGGDISVAFAINDLGQIVGRADTADGTYRATLFDATGGGANRDLGTLGGDFSAAYGINNLGQIVGQADVVDGGGHATLFDPSGGGANRDLGTLSGNSSVATDINNAGQIVGQAEAVDGSQPAAVFAPGGDAANRSLGTLGGDSAAAYAVNDAGQIVGFAETADGEVRAALFDGTGSGDNRDLGTLGEATGINEAGQIVGTDPNFGLAFLFEDGALLDLNDLIDPTGPLRGDVYLFNAVDINNAGQILAYGIVGTGVPPVVQSFLLNPVVVEEPAGLALVGAGFGVLCLLRRRRSKAGRLVRMAAVCNV